MKRILAFNRGSVLNGLLERAAMISSLNNQIKQHLDESCWESVQVANYDGGILSLLVESPSWGTRLRFETPRLLTAFRAAGLPGLCNIKILIRPPSNAVIGKVATVQRPSCPKSAVDELLHLSDRIEQDDLRSSLSKLAMTIRNHHR